MDEQSSTCAQANTAPKSAVFAAQSMVLACMTVHPARPSDAPAVEPDHLPQKRYFRCASNHDGATGRVGMPAARLVRAPRTAIPARQSSTEVIDPVGSEFEVMAVAVANGAGQDSDKACGQAHLMGWHGLRWRSGCSGDDPQRHFDRFRATPRKHPHDPACGGKQTPVTVQCRAQRVSPLGPIDATS